MLTKWLREPLLHFLLIGVALFLLYGARSDDIAFDGDRIVITQARIDRVVSMFEKRWQRLPTESEYAALIEQQIREEVLYREALAMGLDQNDAVVRRRMVQKVEFITADVTDLAEPTDTQLSDYLAANRKQFELPARISFRQIYFNADKRGERVEADIQQALVRLTRPDSTVDVEMQGDPLLFGQEQDRRTKHEVARMFGDIFTQELFGLSVGVWQGPVSSGYGLHLVRIEEKMPATQPELAAVRDNVRTQWLAGQRRAADESFYQRLRQHYDIVVEHSGVEEMR